MFGEKIVNIELQNRVIDSIMATACNKINGEAVFPGPEAVNIIYQYTPISSLARELLVHLWNDAANPQWLTQKLHPDFLEDITLALLKDRERAGKDKPKKSSRVLDAQAYYKGVKKGANAESVDEFKRSR